MHPQGLLMIVLHAHLPYIRHPEREALEEYWLFEAISETYLPLLRLLESLDRDQVPTRLTVSLTPTLGFMLQDPVLRRRYGDYLQKRLALGEKEIERTSSQPQLLRLAEMYHAMYSRCGQEFFDKYGGNLVAAFARFQEKGMLEIIASAATHSLLSVIAQPKAVAAQIQIGVECYREWFSRDPAGFWLPECGYFTGVETALRKNGIQYVIGDSHAVLHAVPKPRYAVYAPVFSPEGVALFGRDYESSKQVWSASEGYPGDYDYRDFYRDVGYDCEYQYISPYLCSGIRGHTGYKYYRITGKTKDKQPYCPDVAREKATVHAGNFMFNREQQIKHFREHMDREPLIVAPYDAELFGHWWFEGPDWLECLVRKIATQDTVSLVVGSEYLQRYPKNQVVTPSMSTWGNGGYNDVWINGANDWVYRHLSYIAEKMVQLAEIETDCPLKQRALNQGARELVLAQSSDWPFIMKTGTVVDYARWRTKQHIHNFLQLKTQVLANSIDENWLRSIESENNAFPRLDYRIFRQGEAADGRNCAAALAQEGVS